jgi:FtsP/CotA-like multicopper oxidase with cupredoxin domain
MLIVEDAAGEIPDEIANMEEFIMMLLHVDMDTIASIQSGFNNALLQVVGTSSTTVLVNGLTQPVVSMESGVWYRWRMCFASIETWATLSFTDTTNGVTCEIQLIAKDGVYLNTAPREVTSLPLYSGTRADAAIRCIGTGTATFGATSSTTVRRQRRLRRNLQQGPPPGGGTTTSSDYTGTILTVNVFSTDQSTVAADLTPFTVNRPCYLSDTQSLTPDITSTLSLDAGLLINGASFVDSSTYLETFTPGSLVELAVSGIHMHPYHQHVNHFQITSITADDPIYFQVGDWMDTISDASDSMTMRFYTDKFAGEMVVHCHLLSHEDKGMMGLWEISGSDGVEYDTSLLDSTCYTETSGSRGGDFTTTASSPTSAPFMATTPSPTIATTTSGTTTSSSEVQFDYSHDVYASMPTTTTVTTCDATTLATSISTEFYAAAALSGMDLDDSTTLTTVKTAVNK